MDDEYRNLMKGEMMNSDNTEILNLLEKELLENALKFGDFTLASGKKSKYYINCKKVTLDARGSYLSGLSLLRLIPLTCEAVGGLTLGADPLVSSLTVLSHIEKRPLKGFLVRKEQKDHGTQNQIENCPPAGTKVVIVDDVITTGGSALKAAEIAMEAGLHVTRAICLVDRCQGGENAFRNLNIPVHSVFKITSDAKLQRS